MLKIVLCVSRDVFNSRFNDTYKEHVEIGETVYQTALPSLVEPAKLEGINNVNNLKVIFRKTLNEEFSGTNMARLTKSRPDFIIIDFFADIHFGVTRKIGRYITRNYMAFKTLSDADIFYKDSESTPPERMRFNDSVYRNLAIDSLYNFQHRLRDELPEVKFIVNSACFSLAYTGNSGEIAQFEKPIECSGKIQTGAH